MTAAVAGPGVVIWDGADDAGHAMASGVYFVRINNAEGSVARKAVLLR